MQKRSGRCQREHEEDRRSMVLTGRSDDHGLAHEAAEQRYRRDGEPANHVKTERDRHALVKTTHFTQFSQPGHLEHGAGSHEEQRLIKDVSERVRCCPVGGECRPDSDAANHVTNLADNVVRQ